MPHPHADPGHPGEPDVDSTVLLVFSDTVTTDQGRIRSVDHPHPDARGCDCPVTGHMRNEETENRRTPRGDVIAVLSELPS